MITRRFIPLLLVALLVGCSENYANGSRIGMVTQFSKAGVFYKSYEGHLNVTQTGMNSSVPFDFSIDNDREDPHVITMIDSAAEAGWKVRLSYHQTFGKNWFTNRGETDHFITGVEVLDRTPLASIRGAAGQASPAPGRTVDTIYVVIVGHGKQP